MKIDIILSQIDLGAMALPEFQRGYVWNRDQVRGLMLSLYKKHPVGTYWDTLPVSRYIIFSPSHFSTCTVAVAAK